MILVMKMNEMNRGIATYNSLLRTQINDFLKLMLKEIGKDELVPSYGTLLSIVYRNGGKVQIKTIYDTILKQKSTITEMINRLVKLGYLEKHSCVEDKRVTYVVVTEKAIAFEPDFNRISKNLMEKVFEGFTEEEKDEYVRLMLKAIKNFT